VLAAAVSAAPAAKKETAKPKAAPKKVAAVKTATLEASAKARPGAAEAMSLAPTKEAVSFKDVKKTDPSYPYVMKMVEAGILSGYPDKTFRGKKTITRAEFSKVMTKSLNYIEDKSGTKIAGAPTTSEVYFKDLPRKHWAYSMVAELVTRYQIFSGYPDKTFKPNKTINRYELATVLAKALKKTYGAVNQPVPAISTLEAKQFADVKPKHWALEDIQLLIKLGIIDYKTETRTETVKGKKVKKTVTVFEGDKPVDRDLAATAVSKLLDLLVEKMPKKFFMAPTEPMMAKYMAVGNAKAYLSGAYGNIMESASQTGNWLGMGGSAIYGNKYDLMGWMRGDYELDGLYRYNQMVYLVPSGGGGIAGGVVNENRIDLDLNTVTPVVNFYGFQGKLLLGLKYATLSNSMAPTNFIAVNAGVATVTPIFGKEYLARAFYSLIPGTAAKNPSALGQPNVLLNYEASTDIKLFDVPLMVGYTGETMFLNGGTFSRFYNMIFARYNLL
jgi:hypothetical protein